MTLKPVSPLVISTIPTHPLMGNMGMRDEQNGGGLRLEK